MNERVIPDGRPKENNGFSLCGGSAGWIGPQICIHVWRIFYDIRCEIKGKNKIIIS